MSKDLFDKVLKVYVDSEHSEYKSVDNFREKHEGYPVSSLFCFTQMLYEYQIYLSDEQVANMFAILTPEQVSRIETKANNGDTFF